MIPLSDNRRLEDLEDLSSQLTRRGFAGNDRAPFSRTERHIYLAITTAGKDEQGQPKT
jgi:hypothetical protein